MTSITAVRPSSRCLDLITGQIDDLQSRIVTLEKAIIAAGSGIITASAITATIADAKAFASGRHFAP